MPTSALASEDLPDPLAPSSAKPVPAESAKDTLRVTKRLDPGGTTARSCTHNCLLGHGKVMAGAGGAAVARKVPTKWLMACRAEMSCFQVPSTISIGARARPIMIEEAIMTPPL